MSTITAQYLKGFFDAEQIEGSSRLTVLLASIKDSDCESLKPVLKEFAKTGKTEKVRASEIRALAGFLITLKGDPLVLGSYHFAIQFCRDELKAAGMTWDGKIKPTKEQKEDSAKTRELSDAVAELLQMGATLSEAVEGADARVAEKREIAEREQAKKLYDSLLKSYSSAFLMELAAYLAADGFLWQTPETTDEQSNETETEETETEIRLAA
jgi:hypothetical protein